MKILGILILAAAVSEFIRQDFGSALFFAVIGVALMIISGKRRKKEKVVADAQPVRYSGQDLPIPVDFLIYLKQSGRYQPEFMGRNDALGYVLADISDTERAEFWAYAVDCALHKQEMGNILDSPNLSRYQDFAEFACRDARLFHSIRTKAPYDYWSPGRGSIAWESASQWFK